MGYAEQLLRRGGSQARDQSGPAPHFRHRPAPAAARRLHEQRAAARLPEVHPVPAPRAEVIARGLGGPGSSRRGSAWRGLRPRGTRPVLPEPRGACALERARGRGECGGGAAGLSLTLGAGDACTSHGSASPSRWIPPDSLGTSLDWDRKPALSSCLPAKAGNAPREERTRMGPCPSLSRVLSLEGCGGWRTH